MIAINNWLAAVVQLFDHTLRALLGEAFFSVLLYFLVLVVSVACGAFQSFTVSTGIRLAVQVIGSALGGFIAVNQKRKVK